MKDQKGRKQKIGRVSKTEAVKSLKPSWVRELTFTPSDFLFSKVLHAERKRDNMVRTQYEK